MEVLIIVLSILRMIKVNINCHCEVISFNFTLNQLITNYYDKRKLWTKSSPNTLINQI